MEATARMEDEMSPDRSRTVASLLLLRNAAVQPDIRRKSKRLSSKIDPAGHAPISDENVNQENDFPISRKRKSVEVVESDSDYLDKDSKSQKRKKTMLDPHLENQALKSLDTNTINFNTLSRNTWNKISTAAANTQSSINDTIQPGNNVSTNVKRSTSGSSFPLLALVPSTNSTTPSASASSMLVLAPFSDSSMGTSATSLSSTTCRILTQSCLDSSTASKLVTLVPTQSLSQRSTSIDQSKEIAPINRYPSRSGSLKLTMVPSEQRQQIFRDPNIQRLSQRVELKIKPNDIGVTPCNGVPFVLVHHFR